MKRLLMAAGLCSAAAIAIGQSGRVGIGTTSPQARLHVADSSVLFSAVGLVQATTGNPPASGSGRRMMWYADKAAFRAGFVLGTFWNKDSIGAYSFAAGYQTKARGQYSVAIGQEAEATGSAALAMGYGPVAKGDGSTALGFQTVATGFQSTALGAYSTASGQASLATGAETIASGQLSTATGYQTTASGQVSFTAGYLNTASGTAAFASGIQTTASGESSFATGSNVVASGLHATATGLFTNAAGTATTAMGYYAYANTDAATAIGYQDTATGFSSVALGGGMYARSAGEVAVGYYGTNYTPNGSGTDRLFTVGNGGDAANRSNAFAVLKNGNTGIGTSSPGVKVDVAAGTATQAMRLSAGQGASDNNGILLIQDNSNNNAGGNNNELIEFLNSSGNIIGSVSRVSGSNSISYNTTSDTRLKTGIRPTHYGLADLMAIQVADYQYKGTAIATPQTGFLAQQLYGIYPEAVTRGNDADEKQPYMVDYSKLTPLLVKALQDMNSKMEGLQLQVKTLQQQNEALQTERQQYGDVLTRLQQLQEAVQRLTK